MRIVFAEHHCPTIQSVEGLVNILIEGCEEAERRGAREPLSEVVVKLNHRTYRVTLTLLDEAAQAAKKALRSVMPNDESKGTRTMKDNKDQKYIVRCDRAGVFYAKVMGRHGSEAELVDARRIYSWAGAATLSQLANEGCGAGSKLTVTVPSMTVLGVIEVIPCSEKAVKVLDGIKEWRV